MLYEAHLIHVCDERHFIDVELSESFSKPVCSSLLLTTLATIPAPLIRSTE